jgi:hypothetical protein
VKLKNRFMLMELLMFTLIATIFAWTICAAIIIPLEIDMRSRPVYFHNPHQVHYVHTWGIQPTGHVGWGWSWRYYAKY